MTEDQRADLLSYFADMAVRLGAPGWQLEVAMQPAGADDDASIFIRDDTDKATLHVPPDFFSKPPEQQRRDLTHEALHLVLDRSQKAYQDAIDGLVPAGFEGPLTTTPQRLHERGIESLAQAIAHLLPLPRFDQP